MYHRVAAKNLASDVVALAINDAMIGDNSAKLWLYTEACETFLLLFDAIAPSRFRSAMRTRVGLPAGFSEVTRDPIFSPARDVLVGRQYGFEVLLDIPICSIQTPDETQETDHQAPKIGLRHYQKRLNPYVLDFSVWRKPLG